MSNDHNIGPQKLRLNWRGEEREFKFNNAAMFAAEDVYDEAYHKKDCSWAAIIKDLMKGKSCAIYAAYYGAVKQAEPELGYDEFEELFKLSDIPAVAEALSKAVSRALPKGEEKAVSKNA